MLKCVILFSSIIFVSTIQLRSSSCQEYIDFVESNPVRIGFKDLILKGKIRKTTVSSSGAVDAITDACENWKLVENDLEGLILKMRQVEPVEWNALCYTYPCYYIGEVENEYDKYTIEINAASFVVLRNSEEEYRFILEEDLQVFLTPCDCCE